MVGLVLPDWAEPSHNTTQNIQDNEQCRLVQTWTDCIDDVLPAWGSSGEHLHSRGRTYQGSLGQLVQLCHSSSTTVFCMELRDRLSHHRSSAYRLHIHRESIDSHRDVLSVGPKVYRPTHDLYVIQNTHITKAGSFLLTASHMNHCHNWTNYNVSQLQSVL